MSKTLISSELIDCQAIAERSQFEISSFKLTTAQFKALVAEVGPRKSLPEPFRFPEPGEAPTFMGKFWGTDVYVKPEPMTAAQKCAAELRKALSGACDYTAALRAIAIYLEKQ